MTPTRTSSGRIRPTLLIALFVLLSACSAPTKTMPVAHAAPVTRLAVSGLTVHRAATSRVELTVPPADDLFVAPVKAKMPVAAPPAREAALPTCPDEGERVLLVGDSLSAGLGPHMGKLARGCGTPFFVHGVVGSHVTQWTQPSWLNAELRRAKPTVVLVSLGGNDFMRNDPHNVERAIGQLVATVRASGARLLWISPPSMPFADAVGARTMWQTALGGAAHIDWYPTEQLDIPRASDHIHPTIAEYAKLSRTLWQWVASVTG